MLEFGSRFRNARQVSQWNIVAPRPVLPGLEPFDVSTRFGVYIVGENQKPRCKQTGILAQFFTASRAPNLVQPCSAASLHFRLQGRSRFGQPVELPSLVRKTNREEVGP